MGKVAMGSAVLNNESVCNPNPCKNEGNCTEVSDSYDCECPEFYFGDHCEIEIDPCSLKPCENGGKCVNISSKEFSCQCPAGYSGKTCETKVFDSTTSSSTFTSSTHADSSSESSSTPVSTESVNPTTKSSPSEPATTSDSAVDTSEPTREISDQTSKEASRMTLLPTLVTADKEKSTTQHITNVDTTTRESNSTTDEYIKDDTNETLKSNLPAYIGYPIAGLLAVIGLVASGWYINRRIRKRKIRNDAACDSASEISVNSDTSQNILV